MDCGCMSLQYYAIVTSFALPEPDRLVHAATGQHAPIWAPGKRSHFVGMPCECLSYTPFFHVPQLDGAIKASARQGASVGSKGQREYPVGMPDEHAGT